MVSGKPYISTNNATTKAAKAFVRHRITTAERSANVHLVTLACEYRPSAQARFPSSEHRRLQQPRSSVNFA